MVTFNSIPAANRVPFTFVEFDNSGAVQGSAIKSYKGGMLGMKLATGTATADTPVLVTSEAQAKTLFGSGSQLHLMCRNWFLNNQFTPLWVIPQAENAGGTAGTKTITVSGTSTAAGTISLYIAGQLISVPVTVGMASTAIAAAINTAIGLVTDLPGTATVATSVVTFLARHKGTFGNEIDIRTNYYSTDVMPAGVTIVIATGVTGATNPVLTNSILGMAGLQLDFIANPYLDAVSLTALLTEMSNRWGPMVQKEGFLFSSMSDTLANMTTFGAGQNSQFLSVLDLYASPTPASMVAAAYAAVAAYNLSIDPARPLQTLNLKGVLPPVASAQRTLTENNTLLYTGIATSVVDSAGSVDIQRSITTYQKNGAGAADPSYLDITTMATLAYLRYDLRTMLQLKYPRHKLANDGTRFGQGQAILTPKAAKAELIARFRIWEENGLVENADAFKAGLIVERNASDPNRLDILMTPDVINGFIVAGAQIKFLV